MLRIHGNRDTLLAALIAHWADQQLGLPPLSAAWAEALGAEGCPRAISALKLPKPQSQQARVRLPRQGKRAVDQEKRTPG